jgi:hypothetical protein
MNLNEQYITALKSIYDSFQSQSIFFVEITNITDAETKGVVSGKVVTSEEVIIDNIYLQGTFSKNGQLIIPKVGSKVFINEIGAERSYILFYSEIEKIIYENGENGGLVKVIELTNKINNLENQINNMLIILKSIIVTPGSPLPFEPIFSSLNNLIITNKNEIENEFIQH